MPDILALLTCLTFHIDLSTSELIRRIGKAMGKSPLLLPIPSGLLRIATKLLGKGEAGDRLLGSLQVDSSKIRETLNWQPPYTVDEGLKVTADWFSKTIKNENRSTFLPNIYQSTQFNSRIIARYS